MFDIFGSGPPEGWEPIPDEVRDELGPWDDEDIPAGMVPVTTGPDDFVWEAVGRQVGVETLALLQATPLDELSQQGLVTALRRSDDLIAHVEAIKTDVTVRLAGREPATEAERRDDYTPLEIGAATRCSAQAADVKILVARQLAARYPATLRAMRDGRIGLSAARHLIESTSHLDDDIRSAVEAKMLVNCHDQSLPNFKRATRRWLEKKDPGFTKRAKAARAECVVAHDAVGNGVGELFIRGPLEITTQISMALTAHAAKTRDMLGGTAAQRKLAGLRDMTEDYLGSPGAAKHHGRLPIVNVTIDLATLLGLRDGVAEIPGVGAIPAEAARWLLADGAPLRRLVIDPLNGHLLDLGTAYTVSPALAEYLCAVNITAATPHSNVESRTADMEHNIPHGQRRDGTGGGATDRINVTPADRRWHRGKTFTDWTYIKDPDSCVVTWTSPTGLTYDIHPYDYRADP